MRIRNKPIRFVIGMTGGEDVRLAILKWGDMEKKMGDFQLTTGQGQVRSAEVIGGVNMPYAALSP